MIGLTMAQLHQEFELTTQWKDILLFTCS